MRKYLTILACLLVISCKQSQETCCPEDDLAIPAATAPSTEINSDSIVDKISQSLEESENIEQGIQHIVEDRATLKVQNHKLTNELKTTKDSLQKITIELKETKLKLPKKRNFLQRVLGVAKDSVEVIKVDTIQ